MPEVHGAAVQDLATIFERTIKALNLAPSAVATARAAVWAALLDAHEAGITQAFEDLAKMTGTPDVRKRAEAS